VLIVDDSCAFRKALRELVNATPGFELVGEEDSGEAAVDAVKVLAPRLVIMDKNMPGIGGPEATRRIAIDHPGIVTLLISVEHADMDVMHRCRATAFLRKQDLSPRVLTAVWLANAA
jgi:DNA-binding NarL/FixJ family response regulator